MPDYILDLFSTTIDNSISPSSKSTSELPLQYAEYTNIFNPKAAQQLLPYCNHLDCYESPKKEQVFHMFKHLVTNIKSYNVDKI